MSLGLRVWRTPTPQGGVGVRADFPAGRRGTRPWGVSLQGAPGAMPDEGVSLGGLVLYQGNYKGNPAREARRGNLLGPFGLYVV